MKKIISFLLLFTLVFSLSGCLSKEQKQKIEMYEKEALEVMTEFFEENYDNYEIVNIEHQKFAISGGIGYNLSSSTKIMAKIDDVEYCYFYNQETKEIFSNINSEKVNKELLKYFEESNFPKNYFDKEIEIYYNDYDFDVNVLNIKDDTLEKVMKRNRETEENSYLVSGDFYYLDTTLDYRDFDLKEFFYEFRDVSISFYNVNKNFEKNPYEIDVPQKLRFQFDDKYDKNVNLDISEYETIEVDDILFIYSPHFFDMEIEKETTSKEKLTDDIYKKTYQSNGVWYKISSVEKYEDFQPPVIIGDYEVSYNGYSGVSIYVKTNDYENKGLYSKKGKYADTSNTDGEYMRFFLFCDDEKETTHRITFVDLK